MRMIQLIRPYVTFADMEQDLRSILDSGMLTKGLFSKKLPHMAMEYTGARHAFLATSATTALTMSLRLLNIGPGDDVLVSDFSFPASVNVIEDVGAHPIFVDVDPETYNVTAATLASRITPRTKAFVFVDALGNPSGLMQIAALCRTRGITLIEDAACALGSAVAGIKCGNVADITCFSLHPRKLITGGEGGIITTNSDAHAAELYRKLNHGMDETGAFTTYGYNYRMPELSCALACKQLESLDLIVAERQAQKAEYARRLAPLGLVPQRCDADVHHNVQSVVFRLPDGWEQAALFAHLRANDVECIFGTYCLSECDYYLKKYNDVQPVSQYLKHHTITLPCYRGVDIDKVVRVIQGFMPHG